MPLSAVSDLAGITRPMTLSIATAKWTSARLTVSCFRRDLFLKLTCDSKKKKSSPVLHFLPSLQLQWDNSGEMKQDQKWISGPQPPFLPIISSSFYLVTWKCLCLTNLCTWKHALLHFVINPSGFFFPHKNVIAKQKQRGVHQVGLQLPAKMEFPPHGCEQSHDPLSQRQFW